jgi:hypothetical protein
VELIGEDGAGKTAVGEGVEWRGGGRERGVKRVRQVYARAQVVMEAMLRTVLPPAFEGLGCTVALVDVGT